MDNKRLYVGNLSWQVTDDDLKAFFSSIGEVISATVILDRDTGRSRGFGFIEMITEDQARLAIEQLNGKSLMGRNILVKEAKVNGNNYLRKIEKFFETAIAGEKLEVEVDGKHFYIIRDERG